MDPETREKIWEQCKPYLKRVLQAYIKLDCQYEKDDLIEECLEQCLIKLPKYEGRNNASLKTFLVSVARNYAYDKMRKTYRHADIGKENWHLIVFERWVTGGHDRPSKEDWEIISAVARQPLIEIFK